MSKKFSLLVTRENTIHIFKPPSNLVLMDKQTVYKNISPLVKLLTKPILLRNYEKGGENMRDI